MIGYLKDRQKTVRVILLILCDILILNITPLMALLLRFDLKFSTIPAEYLSMAGDYALINTAAGLFIFALHHTIEGNYLFEGTIYSENYNSTDFEDPNTVLYGHTMRKNDAMFTSLHNYTDKDFFDSNRTVYIYMPGQVLEYKIFAAYAYDDRHLMLSFDFEDKTVFKNYLDSIFAVRDMTANIDKTVEITENDRIITLSTCIDGQDTKRFLVQAVLVQSTPSAR